MKYCYNSDTHTPILILYMSKRVCVCSRCVSVLASTIQVMMEELKIRQGNVNAVKALCSGASLWREVLQGETTSLSTIDVNKMWVEALALAVATERICHDSFKQKANRVYQSLL